MRILFIGGTRRGYLTLAALLKNGHDVVGVLSLRQDAHETEQYADAIRDLATERAIKHFESRSLKEKDYAEIIKREIRPDVALVVGCRILLPQAIFEAPPRGTLAAHDSLLPAYRGFAPLNWSIINGERQTGVTLFYVSDRMDAGDIVGQRVVPISEKDTAPAVHERVCQATIDLVLETIPLLAAGTAPRQPQAELSATVTCSRTPDDGLVEWTNRTVDVLKLVRALTAPYPGAFTFHAGRRLMVWRAEQVGTAGHFVGRTPGRVVAVNSTDGWVDVLTGDGVVRLFEVQEESGGPVAAASVIRSVRATLGLRPLDLLARIRRLEQQVDAQRAALAMMPAASSSADFGPVFTAVPAIATGSTGTSGCDVIIPCYNYGRFLRRCVDSVLSQSGVHVRVLVIDDASTDETPIVAAELAREDRRVEFVRHSSNRGHVATYNEGLEWISAECALLLSADDLLLPGALARAAQIMNNHPRVALVYGRQVLFRGDLPPGAEADERDGVWQIVSGREFIRSVCAQAHNPVATPTAVVRTSVQRQVGGYRQELPHTCDMEMWLRLAASGDVGVLQSDQALKRQHDWNMQNAFVASTAGDLEQRLAAFEIFFTSRGDQVHESAQLKALAMRGLASQAFWNASRAFDCGDEETCVRLRELAARLNPELRLTVAWSRLIWKCRMGVRAWTAVRPFVDRARGVSEELPVH